MGDFTLQDPDLESIAGKVMGAERLSKADALTLFRTDDLLGLGSLANFANREKNGDRVFFASNQHINPTNVCILRKTCTFCSFARTPKEEGAYTRTLEEVWEEAETARGSGIREFHIVGGLHPKLRLSYYIDLIEGLKERHTGVHVKALTAVEIAHLARIEKTSSVEVLMRLKDAGLNTMPGGGAEVFSSAVRVTLAERKLAAQEWIRIHREAHSLGIRTNCTMLYGHVESLADRVEHLDLLRTLQDETGGFLTYIPLAYHPDNNELGKELGRQGTATTGYEDLKNIAVGRLFLDNVHHIKTHWPMVTPLLSQIALEFGCDDLEGTVIYERVYHEAGAVTPMRMTYDEILRFIRGAGKQPEERDSLYNTIRSFEPGSGTAKGVSKHGSEKTRDRLGRIAYVNCYPVYAAIDRGIVRCPADLVTGSPAELNDLLAAGELDVSVISAVEYSRNSHLYYLLPELAISCDGPVRSVMLFSKIPLERLDGATILVSQSSRTSVLLLELLCAEHWGVEVKLVEARAEASDLDSLAMLPHDGVLVIGDAALLLGRRPVYEYGYDLGSEWKKWTGLPFVFAVWAARRDSSAESVKKIHAALLESRDWGMANLDQLAAAAAEVTGMRQAECSEYLVGINYDLSYAHIEGLTYFFRRLADRGIVKNGTLSFISAA